jgi:hypothetical protein
MLGTQKNLTPPKDGKLFVLECCVSDEQDFRQYSSRLEAQFRHYQHVYLAMQRRSGIWTVEGKAMHTCFCKLAEEIEALESEGREINIIDFFEAHKQKYGKYLRPNHLVSSKSLRIYTDYMTQKYTPTFELTEEESQVYTKETIAKLARIRGESKAAVTKMLRYVGLM